jgi:hypothetical protein
MDRFRPEWAGHRPQNRHPRKTLITGQQLLPENDFCNRNSWPPRNFDVSAFAEMPLHLVPSRYAVCVFCLQIAVAIWRWTAKHPELEPAGLAWVRAAREAIQIMEEA